MSRVGCGRWAGLLLMGGLIGCHRVASTNDPPASDDPPPTQADPFLGSKGGDEREGAGVKLG